MRTSSGSFMCSKASSSTRWASVAENSRFSRWSGRRQAPHDVADVGDEAEVEHAVRLVEHQHLHRGEVEHALLVEVDQAARRADQDVDALLEIAALLLVVHAAEGEAELQAGVLAEDLRVVVDLHRELARRRDDQRERGVDLARRRAPRCAGSASRARPGTPRSCRCRSAPARPRRIRPAPAAGSGPGSACSARSRRRQCRVRATRAGGGS